MIWPRLIVMATKTRPITAADAAACVSKNVDQLAGS
jgi:hypothetical protein